jgi:nucleotidyltransferase/DNA polymerase involved in DNA repair
MRLACVTVPDFRIALERQRAPGLARVPVAIGEPPPGRGDVLECSAEASARGIRVGMPLRDARTLLPDLIVLPPDPAYYARSFDMMLDALEQATPQIEPGEPGVAFAECVADPLATDHDAGEQAAAARLVHTVREVTGVIASAGVGDGKFVARVAATVGEPGQAMLVHAGEEEAFVAPLSTSLQPDSN